MRTAHRIIPYLFPALLGVPVVSACDCGDSGLINAQAVLEVTPLERDFGQVQVDDLRVLAIEVSNKGMVALQISDFSVHSSSTEFAFASPLPTTMQGQQSARINLVYQPTNLGVDEGTITIASDTGQDPITVALRGEGVESGVGITTDGELCDGQEGSLSFGRVRPGQVVEKHVTVVASGALPLTLWSAVREPGSAAEFEIDGAALPVTLQPGEELVLTARYSPVDGGDDAGAFVITTDAASAPSIRIPVCGAGIAPAVCARPVPLDLGAIPESQSATGTLTIESCGLEPLDLTAISLANDAAHQSNPAFQISRNAAVPRTLMPGETVDIDLSFASSQPFGSKSAWVQVDSNALSGTSYFPVTARTAQPCGLSVVPALLTFHNVAQGANARKSVLIVNDGGTDCSLTALNVTTTGGGNEFHLPAPPTTPTVVAAGASLTLEVEYAPGANPGPHTGELQVVEAAGGISTVALSGNPAIGPECVVDISPTTVSFGVVGVGSTAHQGVEVSNISDEACRISGVRLLGGNPAFTATSPGLGFLVPNTGRSTIDIAYAPTMLGAQHETLEITVAGVAGAPGGGTFLVGIFAATGEARLCVMPPQVPFGTLAAGATATQDVVITSCGSATLNLRGALLSPGSAPAFSIAQAPTTPANLAVGGAAAPVLRVRYAPTGAGPDFGQIELLSNDSVSPNTLVQLSGNWDQGCTKILSCTPAAITFGDTDTERPKLVRVVCRNNGPNPVAISSASLSGGAGEISLVGGGAATVPPGGVWTVDVSYDPGAAGADAASLTINSDACLGPGATPISGTGVVVPLPPCQPPSTFQPVLEWEWTGSSVEPNSRNVWMTPLVANLTDDNVDGVVDDNDVPEVVFVSYETNSLTDINRSEPGVLRVVSGDTGVERFSVASPHFPDSSQLAIGDLDDDGSPEIVGFKWFQTPPGTGTGNFLGRYTTATLVALDRTGRLLWESDPLAWAPEVTWNAAGISLADLDGDGLSEIIVGREVFDHRGHLRWRGTGDAGYVPGGPQSIVVDIDNDGRPEVLAGGTVYNADGTIRFDVADNFEGGVAVGRLDPSDPYPEIAVFTNDLTVYDHLGIERWHGNAPTSGPSTQLPTIADFDGDGDGDIAVADGNGVTVFRGTGGIMWAAPVSDTTCCPGISAFDFEGDGSYELLLNDFGNIYVYRGATGNLLYTAERPSQTNLEMPVVADIDHDQKAEIVVALQFGGGGGGVRAYSNVGDSWVQAPPIWNQQSYYVDNVTASGAIPRVLPPFRANGPFRGTTARCQ